MKKLVLTAAVALVTSGCSPAMYGALARPRMTPSPYLRPGVHVAEQVPIGRWDNVMRLPRWSTVDVLTADGAANVGQIAGADLQNVRLVIDGTEVRIARADVVRVDLVDVAGSETSAVARRAARGALIGAGLVALVTGVVGEGYWPPPGQALRAGAAVGGVTAGHAEILKRAGRMIYLAADPGGPPRIR